MATRSPRSRQHGFSIIEIMVGVVIGMIAVLVIYQVFATSEGIKRNITAAGDAQQNGLLSSFMMGIELANAGNGLAVAAQDLGTCTPAANATDSLRPIPLLITDGGGANNPDSFVIYYSAGRTLVSAAPMQPPAGLPGPYTDWYVQSANGFKAGDAQNKPDAMVLISQGGNCYSSQVDGVSAPPDANGVVKISQSRVGALAYDSSWTLFNLGPANLVQKVRYDVGSGSLRSTSLVDPATGAPDNAQPVNPLVSNILNMKIQYGIDNVGDGLIHHWVPATAGTAYGDWDPATLLAAPIATINRIKAARIAILVKSEQHDKDLAGQGFTRTVFNDCADGGTCYPVTFDIPAISAGTQPWGWRYRVYETVIPLRNEVWNKEV
jgi:type IV pilus assembly protein PilW